ncbi:MAG: hypothetical protein WD904_04970 [Dehalococcoidia bacterium]
MMWRMPLALVIVAMTMPFLGPHGSALGCSGGRYPNYAAESELIVGGRVTGWEVADNAEPPSRYHTRPIILSFEVQDSIKSHPPTRIEIVDRYSLDETGRFGGESLTLCGGPSRFTENPTGQYVIMGLSSNGDTFERGHILYRSSTLEKDEALAVVTQIAQDPYGGPSLTITLIMSMVPAMLVWLWLLRLLGAWSASPSTVKGG